MLFNQTPGLEEVKTTLRRSVDQSHVAHALLFDGPVGGGALSLALAFATYVNCENRQETDACGHCASCVKMDKLAHPDLHSIFPLPRAPKEGEDLMAELTPQWRKFIQQSPFRTLQDWLTYIQATQNQQGIIPIKEARGIITKLSLKAFEAEYKVMMVWQPELLNQQASNALLKILEEPPQKTLFLLVTEQSDRLLTTILSRTQRLQIPAFSDQDVRNYLQQHHEADSSRARQIAYLCDGNLSEAHRLLLEQEDDRSAWFTDWMRSCYKYDLLQLVKLADTFEGMGKERQKGLFDYALRLFRDMILWTQGAGALLRVPDEELDFVQKFSKAVPATSWEPMISEMNDAYYHIERNVRAKIVFLDLSLHVSQLFQRN
ncbi:DNA polymerase III subunit delta' [Arundinibacter roseus]|uniref:DNA polymerase III subunit delta n=1 Tax=Arundinibacter roseus TaxID=2070510 RepID=A0A4R4JUK2_9BACT|nr:DNA polymerase III subunit delta' [Arundinibacter roseus]TDB57209.1 DNA polymerase III subunit delta' [Arundinibacter roseus]